MNANLTIIDSILMERFGQPGTCVSAYTAECFYRINEAQGKKWVVSQESQKQLLTYLQTMLINYAGVSYLQPDIFPEQIPTHSRYTGVSLSAFRLKEFILTNFQLEVFQTLLQYWERENPEFRSSILVEVLTQVFDDSKLARGDHSAQLSLANTCKVLFEFKELAVSATHLPNWLVGSSRGDLLESQSAISSLFSPTWFCSTASSQKRPGLPPPSDPIRDRIGTVMEKLRSKNEYYATLEYHQRSQHELTDALTEVTKLLIKADKEVRHRQNMLNWLAEAVLGNVQRTKMGRSLEKSVGAGFSSDGFCFNVLDVLLALCSPFLDPNAPMIQKIDPKYLLTGPRLKLPNETAICTKPLTDPIPSVPYGTITEFYFLCLCMFHYAWHGARTTYFDLIRLINNIKDKKDPVYEQETKYYMKVKFCSDFMLMDKARNGLLVHFCSLTMHLLVKWSGFDGKHLPLPSPPSVYFRGIPEFAVEDISEFFIFISQIQPEIFRTFNIEDCDRFASFMTICLSSPIHLTNPYLRAKQVQMLSHMIESENPVPAMQSALQQNEVAKAYFLEALVQFYVDIETTGSHGQFYEKFSYRHYATRIFMFLWRFEHYQEQTIALAQSEYFVKFVNMLINDTTFTFDESLIKLQELKKLEVIEVERPLTPEEQKNFEQYEGICKSYMLQTNEAVEKLERLTAWDREVFLSESFSARFAAMLNYFLSSLCGPKCLEVKVKDPNRYSFQPIEMLAGVIRCYLNLMDADSFKEAIITDARSYNHDVMVKAVHVCYKRMVVNQEERSKFEQFVTSLRDMSHKQASIEELLGEIPDEFMCPISCELMKNPVRLPGSGTICDRATIERHLLNDPHDPFNRQPLLIEDVVNDVEMKQKIDEWVKAKLAGR